MSNNSESQRHASWAESGFRHYQCMSESKVVAVPKENEQNVRFCPSCGDRLGANSLLSEIEKRSPGLALTSGVFGTMLLMAGVAKNVPVRYGSEVASTGHFQITLLGVAVFFAVSVALASFVDRTGRLVSGGVSL